MATELRDTASWIFAFEGWPGMSSQSRFSDGRLGAPPPQPMWLPQGVTPGVRTLNEPTISLKRVHTPPADGETLTSRPEPKVPRMVRAAEPAPAAPPDPSEAPPAAPVAKAAAPAPEEAQRAARAAAAALANSKGPATPAQPAPAPITQNQAEVTAEVSSAGQPPSSWAAELQMPDDLGHPVAAEWVEPEWAEDAFASEPPAAAPLAYVPAPAPQPTASSGLVADVRRRMQAAPPPAPEAPPASRFRAMLSNRGRAAATAAPEAYAAVPAPDYADPAGHAAYHQASAGPDAAWPAEAHPQYAGQHDPNAQYAPAPMHAGWQQYPAGYDPNAAAQAGGWPENQPAEGIDYDTGEALPAAPRSSLLPFAALGLAGVLALAGSAYLGGWLDGPSAPPAGTVAAAPAARPAKAVAVAKPVAKASDAKGVKAPAAAPAAPVAAEPPPGSAPREQASAPAAEEPPVEASTDDKPFVALIECPGMTEAKEIRVEGPDAAAVRAGIAQSLPTCRVDRVTEAGAASPPEAGDAG